MKKQVVVIHGGDVFNSYEEYIEGLKEEEVDIADFRKRYWKKTLEERLGEGFEVVGPEMPNENNAKYLEWKIWFDKIAPQLNDGVILIGHSLGGIFLAKYLSENRFPRKIRATFLIAPPYDDGTSPDPLADFSLVKKLDLLAEQGGDVRIYYSTDDPVVPFADAEMYLKVLPKAHAVKFTDKGHFIIREFPEIVEDIRKEFSIS